MTMPDIRATCARCPVEIVVTEDCQDWRAVFNRLLVARGEQPIDVGESALCDDCYPGWQAERAAFAAEQRERVTHALVCFKADCEEHGVNAAFARLPDSLRGDIDLQRRAQDYARWWRTEGQHKKKRGGF
jgi:hypothetical protein